jgi:hypothetical protein
MVVQRVKRSDGIPKSGNFLRERSDLSSMCWVNRIMVHGRSIGSKDERIVRHVWGLWLTIAAPERAEMFTQCSHLATETQPTMILPIHLSERWP